MSKRYKMKIRDSNGIPSSNQAQFWKNRKLAECKLSKLATRRCLGWSHDNSSRKSCILAATPKMSRCTMQLRNRNEAWVLRKFLSYTNPRSTWARRLRMVNWARQAVTIQAYSTTLTSVVARGRLNRARDIIIRVIRMKNASVVTQSSACTNLNWCPWTKTD